jgi:hypothetical protein
MAENIVVSPAAAWPGTVELHDPMNYDQAVAWEDAHEAARQFTKLGEPGRATVTNATRYMHALLPGVLACVKAWRLGGGFPERPTVETFPARPLRQSVRLLAAVDLAITQMANEPDEPPAGG